MRTLLLLVLLAACDSQVDASYLGTPLARLSGTVRNTRTLAVGDAEVVAFWYADTEDPGDRHGTAEVAVDGAFPARFALSIFEPPAEPLLNPYPGLSFGVAFIIAAKAGTDFSTEQGFFTGLLGMEVDHLLVYLPADVPDGSFASYMLRGLPVAGYHLYGIHRLTEEEAATRQACIEALGDDPAFPAIYTQCGGFFQFDDFVPLDSDLDTPLEIELVDDPSTIRPPNWT